MALTAAEALKSLFGKSSQISQLVQNFDFSKIDVNDNSKHDYLTVALAPSYGTLTSESMKMMDDELKIMIAATVKTLGKIPSGERSWDAVMSAVMQNPLLEPAEEGIARADKLIKQGVNVFKTDGSPDASIVREVESWFVKLINDQEVLKATQIDIDVVAKIVAQTGATVDSFETIFYKDERHEKTLVDIGVLRFPDPDHPYFKIYRIKLVAWSISKRVLFLQDDQNGITGEYSSRKFKPRDSVIKDMKKSSHDAAVKEADDMFPS